jgi:uncharacterized protein YjbJ (UPF0337 family)
MPSKRAFKPVRRYFNQNLYLDFKMKSLNQIKKAITSLALSAILSAFIAISFGCNSSLASPISGSMVGMPQTYLAIMNPVQAAAKDIEGKTQEAIGDITKSPKDQLIGKAKQAQSEANRVAAKTEASLKKSKVGEKVAKVAKDVKKLVKR